MDYRALLAAPLAALVMSSSASELRMPADWQAHTSFTWPITKTYEAGVDPQAEEGGVRALTIKSVGTRSPTDIGTVEQFGSPGYAGKRVRLSGQLKATGGDGWAGLVLSTSPTPMPLYLFPGSGKAMPYAGAACPQWCEVSVVADMPADNIGMPVVGVALMGNGQVWARRLRIEVVGPEVALTSDRFAAALDAERRAQQHRQDQEKAQRRTPPQNLALQ
jgi:hypothetical protein